MKFENGYNIAITLNNVAWCLRKETIKLNYLLKDGIRSEPHIMSTIHRLKCVFCPTSESSAGKV